MPSARLFLGEKSMNAPSKEASRTLRQALAFSATEPSKALTELESGLVNARAVNDIAGISSLARHAAVLCVRMGDARRALEYYDEAQRFDRDEPYLYLAIGNLRRELSEIEAAKAAFARALELAREQKEAELATLAQDLLNQLDSISPR